MLITESHDDDHGLLTMYDSTNDILIALEKNHYSVTRIF